MIIGNKTRREALKLIGIAGVATGVGVGTTQASDASNVSPDVDDLRLVGEVPVPETSILDVRDNYVYVSTWSGFAVVDAHHPAEPQVVAEVDVPGVGVHENYIRVNGTLLAVTSQGHGLAPLFGIDEGERKEIAPDDIGVQFYDVSNPTEPEHLGTWRDPPAGIHNLFLDGDFAYLSKAFPFDDSGLRIVDVSDPTDPTEVAMWRVEDRHPELDQPVNFLHANSVQDGLAYLAYWDAGGRILDVSDPADPFEVSSFGEAPDAREPVEGDFETLFEDPESEFSRRLAALPGNYHTAAPSLDGQYVYMGQETMAGPPGGIDVFDVSDHDNPVEVARIEPPSDRTSEYAHYYQVTPDRLHSAWIEGGVRVFDIADPTNPTEVSRYNPDGFSSWIAETRLSFTIADFEQTGVVFLHKDLGEHGPPTIGENES